MRIALDRPGFLSWMTLCACLAAVPLSAVHAATAAPADRPQLYTTPDQPTVVEGPFTNIDEAWTRTPEPFGPRGATISCMYDNGAPLDDYGRPATQLSEAPAIPAFRFIAAAADDFILEDPLAPDTACNITLVRAAFSFGGSGATGSTPLNRFQSIFITVYPDSVLGGPDGEPNNSGGQIGNFIVSQNIPVSSFLSQTTSLTCQPVFVVDIPVNFVLEKNTKYWISLVPRFPAPPQSFWSISTMNYGDPAFTGASFESGFWFEFTGNFGNIGPVTCPNAPPAGTRQDLSFVLFGEELPPNQGACCHQSTGICQDVLDESACNGSFDLFTPGTTCQFADCHVVTGACCDDATHGCNPNINISACTGPTKRFTPGVQCGALDPLCGTLDIGACCFPDRSCVNFAPPECAQSGGIWNNGECFGFFCPPPNDHCANATNITNGLYFFDTGGADTDGEPITPMPGCADPHQDIWFRYTASCTGTVVVATCFETFFDSALVVYDGCFCAPSDGPQYGCDNDACGPAGGPSFLAVPAIAGQCLLIRVGGVDSAQGPGTLIVGCVLPNQGACCLPDRTCTMVTANTCTGLGGVFSPGELCSPQLCPPPENDLCPNALEAFDGDNPFDTRGTFTTTDGPLDGSGPSCATATRDIWFTYNATCTGNLTFSLCNGATFDTALEVYSGCSCPPLLGPRIGCDNNGCGGSAGTVTVPALFGHCYLVRIGGVSEAMGAGTLNITCDLNPVLGACCHADGTCSVGTEADCLSASGRIGIDARNGRIADDPAFSSARNRITLAGYAIVPLADFSPATLAGLDALIMGPPKTGSPLSVSEIQSIHDFVAAGGGLLITAEADPDSAVGNLNTLAAPFNVAFAAQASDPNGKTIGPFVATFLTTGLGSIRMDETRPMISVNPPAFDLAADNDATERGHLVEVAPTFANGAVVLLADESMFADAGQGGDADITSFDNGLFFENILAYIAPPALNLNTFFPDVSCGQIVCPQPPANDHCTDKIQITGPNPSHPDPVVFDTRLATTDPDAPDTNCGPILQDIWFNYEAPCDGQITFSTQGSFFDTSLAIYGPDANGCPGLCPQPSPDGDDTEFDCNDDNSSGSGTYSYLIVPATTGDCFKIRIGGRDQGEGLSGGDGVLNVDCFPLNEGACCAAIGCTIGSQLDCTNLGGSFHGGEPCSLVSCPPPGPGDCCHGDTNGDGIVDARDIQGLVNALLAPPPLNSLPTCRADADEDNDIDMDDVDTFIQKLLLKANCEEVPVECCLGDTDASGTHDGADIQGFLDALLTPPADTTAEFCRANTNNDATIDDQDIAPFVTLLLAGADCPPPP